MTKRQFQLEKIYQAPKKSMSKRGDAPTTVQTLNTWQDNWLHMAIN